MDKRQQRNVPISSKDSMAEAFKQVDRFNIKDSMAEFQAAIKSGDHLDMEIKDNQQQHNVLISSKDSMAEAFRQVDHFNIKDRMADLREAFKLEDRMEIKDNINRTTAEVTCINQVLMGLLMNT